MQWAVLKWDRKARVADVIGFVQGEHQPGASKVMMDRWPVARRDASYFVRPAEAGTPDHYSTVPLRAGR